MKELKNASFAMAGSFASIPLQILGGIFVARYLGPAIFGNYSFAVAFSYFFSCFADGGLSILATRELARNRELAYRYLTSLVFLKLLFSIGFFLLMLVAARFWRIEGHQLLILIVIGVGNFLSSLCIFLVGIARAYEENMVEGIVNFSQALIFIVLLGLLSVIWQGINIESIAICFMGSYLLAAMIGLGLLNKYLHPLKSLDLSLTIILAKEAFPIAIGLIVLSIYSRTGLIILEAGSTAEEVGYFNASLRLAMNTGFFPSILAGAWMPMLARTVLTDKETFDKAAQSLIKYLIIGGLLLTVPLGLSAEGLIALIYGLEFINAAPSFALSMAAMFFFFISFWPKTLLESSGLQIGWGISACAGLAVNILVTGWLAPRFGATGASVGLLVANMVIALLSFYFCARWICLPTMVSKSCKIFFGGVIMALTTWVLIPIHWMIAGIAGGLSFLVYLYLVGEVRWIEIEKMFRNNTPMTKF